MSGEQPTIGNTVSAEDFEGVLAEVEKAAPTEQTKAAPLTPSAVDNPEQPAGTRPARPGSKFTEFSSPEEAARFKRVYGHMKEYERQNQGLVQEIAELRKQVAGITTSQETRETTAKISEVKGRLRDAMQRADYDAAADAQDELADIRTELKLAARETPKAKRPTSEDGEDENALSEHESATISEWRRANDYAREGHPQFKKVQSFLTAVANDPEFDGADLADIFNEVDRLMKQEPTFGRRGGKQPASPPRDQETEDRDQAGRFVARTLQPMGRGQAPAQQAPKGPTLTADQKRVAENMFMGTPLAKTAADAHKLYATQAGMGRSYSAE